MDLGPLSMAGVSFLLDPEDTPGPNFPTFLSITEDEEVSRGGALHTCLPFRGCEQGRVLACLPDEVSLGGVLAHLSAFLQQTCPLLPLQTTPQTAQFHAASEPQHFPPVSNGKKP